VTSLALTRRQRTAPPSDRMAARRMEAGGGYDQVEGPRTLAAGIVDTRSRYPGTAFDQRVFRDRQPFYAQPHYTPPPITWISWTAAGPTRPELHMRNATWRNLAGNSKSRYPVIDSPTTGMHTMGPAGTERTMARYVTTPQMVGERQMRLSPGQYTGQTYSQTTRIQGGRKR
jgi:hypothetical protein